MGMPVMRNKVSLSLLSDDPPSRFLEKSVLPLDAAPIHVKTTGGAPRTSVLRNPNMEKLQKGYLFPEISIKHEAHLKKYPDAKVISLGIGDTTEPIPSVITSAMAEYVLALSTPEGYQGYGPEQGQMNLRKVIAEKVYPAMGIKESEVFISDGAQCDIARLQTLFGPNVTIAVQDPTFPGYVDNGVIVGQTGSADEAGKYAGIAYMRCAPENHFFPDLSRAPRTDVIFFCSPNNPTGHAASAAQLRELVDFARRNGSIIVFDTAYACVAQAGGLACLSTEEGRDAVRRVVGVYKDNARVLVDTFASLGKEVYGGTDSPYVWVRFPGHRSWDVFAEILEKTHVITVPGSGFGPGGEGFIRVSAFNSRDRVLEAAARLKKFLA
ncbi:unnamed protein product [Miscanthus lutarioriparius]|uniref:Aminotransferase class I/classII large domain-containing protein n=1 Tax=Miscanthus lutarioriparius TaxID=422564 RepID=A0A811M892_9POAL|nr:unnamed protein product [Miscanthus lutarioriparius]